MKYMNHITLNTMDVRKTYPSEIDKDIYFILKGIVSEAKKNEYVEILDDTYLSLTIESKDIYAATLLYKKQFPVLTSYGVRKKRKTWIMYGMSQPDCIKKLQQIILREYLFRIRQL